MKRTKKKYSDLQDVAFPVLPAGDYLTVKDHEETLRIIRVHKAQQKRKRQRRMLKTSL